MSLIKRPLQTKPYMGITRSMCGNQDHRTIIAKLLKQAKKAQAWGLSKGMSQVNETRGQR